MVVARREEGKRDVIEHLLLFLTPLARPHAATFRKVIHTEARRESEHGQKKQCRLFRRTSEEHVWRRLHKAALCNDSSQALPVIVNFCCMEPVCAARKKTSKKNNKLNLDKQFYSTKPAKENKKNKHFSSVSEPRNFNDATWITRKFCSHSLGCLRVAG